MRHRFALCLLCGLIGLAASLGFWPKLALARLAPNPCDAAAATAANQIGVPVDVLMGITRVETGRTIDGTLSPWPWTVNQAGSGSFFDSAQDAIAHVRAALDQGQRNIDIGCFQINIRWHGAEFTSVEAMFEPTENAVYAARFLLQLYHEFGDWDDAIGAYHSRKTAAATTYALKVARVMESTPDRLTLSTPFLHRLPPPKDRENRYPLLQLGHSGQMGSLVANASDHPLLPLFQ